MRRGVTLVEILLVIGISAVVLALAIAGLRGSRTDALRLKCLIHCRECSDAITAYTNDFRSFFPHFAERTVGPAFENGGMPLEYSLQTLHWPLALRGYLGERRAEPAQFCPRSRLTFEIFGGGDGFVQFFDGYTQDYVPPAEYWLSYATMTDPKIWQPGGSFQDASLYRAVGAHEVTHPSLKGVLVETRAYHLLPSPESDAAPVSIFYPAGAQLAYSVAFADGHAATVRYADLTPGFVPQDMEPVSAAPVLATPDGIWGSDKR